MAELTYTRADDDYIRDLVLDERLGQDVCYGKYGSFRRDYLREHRSTLRAILANSGRLTEHLKKIERTARRRMDMLLPRMMEAAGVTEYLKAHDQIAWIGLVSNCRAQADEIILLELVYV